MTAMAALHALGAFVAATNNAPMDWVYGTAASVVFVALIVVPAAVLNARDRKRRQGTPPN